MRFSPNLMRNSRTGSYKIITPSWIFTWFVCCSGPILKWVCNIMITPDWLLTWSVCSWVFFPVTVSKQPITLSQLLAWSVWRRLFIPIMISNEIITPKHAITFMICVQLGFHPEQNIEQNSHSSQLRRQLLTSVDWCKKDVTPLLTHWSYVFLALTHRHDLFTAGSPSWSGYLI